MFDAPHSASASVSSDMSYIARAASQLQIIGMNSFLVERRYSSKYECLTNLPVGGSSVPPKRISSAALCCPANRHASAELLPINTLDYLYLDVCTITRRHVDDHGHVANHKVRLTMVSVESRAEAVKAAIRDGTASSSTVAILQHLLGLRTRPETSTEATLLASRNPKSAAATKTRTTKTLKSAKPVAKGPKKVAFVPVLEDDDEDPKTLPPKARYALATEVVNISLKVLQNVAKTVPNHRGRGKSTDQEGGESPPRPAPRSTCSTSQRALQVRSNNASSVKPPNTSEVGEKSPVKGRTTGASNEAAPWSSTAECARLAFSQLRSVNRETLGLRAGPAYQLETGMLALISRMISLGLDGLAARELCAVKKSLQSHKQSTNARQTHEIASTDRRATYETLASLLKIDLDLSLHPEVGPLVMTYWSYVLHLLANSHKATVIEEAIPHLELDRPGSVVSSIVEYAKTIQDKTKASKQLDALFHALMRLCPSASVSADVAALDTARYIEPLSAFRVHCMALAVRKELLQSGDQAMDVKKTITDSLAKSMNTLIRRLPPGAIGPSMLKTCQSACQGLIDLHEAPSEDCSATFAISLTMSILAERAGDPDQACLYAERANAQCTGLERNHARVVAGLARFCSANLVLENNTKEDTRSLNAAKEVDLLLQQSLSGSASDYETLLGELAQLLKCFLDTNDDKYGHLHSTIAMSAASFASRYARLSPGKQPTLIRDIISVALRVSRTNEDLLKWVTKDTAHALVRGDMLQKVAERAAHESLARAWSCSRAEMGLSRVLSGVVLKAAVTSAERSVGAIYDDENLGQEERGVVLEWQLEQASELIHKPKYDKALGALLAELSARLAQVYAPSAHPIRRARVLARLMRIRAVKPDLLSSHSLHALTSIIVDDELDGDDGLKPYLDDIRVSIAVARLFEDGKPDSEALGPHLYIWQRLLNGCKNADALHRVVDNPAALAQQLTSLGDYFGSLGDNASQLKLSRLLCQVQQILGQPEHLCAGLVRTTRSYLLLGYAEKAALCLQQAREIVEEADSASLAALEYHITAAQYLLCVDEPEKCSKALQKAAEVRAQLTAQALRSHQSKAYRLAHVRGWLVQSQYLHVSGQPREALRAAKRSVQIANNIWAGLEKCAPTTGTSPLQRNENGARPVDTLARGISKLNLTSNGPVSDKLSVATSSTGAAFWALVPLMCQALMHLADVFTHHGVFAEANYSSEQATRIAEQVQSHEMLSLVRYHRSLLLTRAGKVEEAELCLAYEQDSTRLLSPLTKAHQLRAKAMISAKIGDIAEASILLRKAETIVKQIQSEPYISSLETYPDDTQAGTASLTVSQKPVNSRQKAVTSKPRVATRRTAKVVHATANPLNKKPIAAAVPKENTAWGACYVLQKLEAQVMLQDAILSTQVGSTDAQNVSWRTDYCKIFPETFARRQLGYLAAMREAEVAIKGDLTFNALAESTLAFPALQAAQRGLPSVASTLQLVDKPASKGLKVAKSKVSHEASLIDLLVTARQCLNSATTSSQPLSTIETHTQCALLADTAMVLSATATSKASEILHPVQETLNIELPRIHAAHCISRSAKLDSDITQSSELLLWPQLDEHKATPQLTARQFQDDYINILPLPWTAVSLSLNEKCDELYVARYRSGQTPLLIRLPFSRQKSEDDDEGLFDFEAGKAELREIIELSNYSCHSSIETNAKGAKTNWWSEREALDRRLQGLLINIENIWLGGFRGVFSQHDRNDSGLSQFRKAFESTLDRHLPSRKVRGSKKLALDDQILELFIGLGTDLDGEVDLDEPLADLLYFAVDMLQFNGERNAYDEIDFDSMAVEVLDALRTYYDIVGEQSDAAHLILVLDRRLQAFPWESMPCIEKSSVSRVDSMLTLRERIMTMRMSARQDDTGGCYTISKYSGAYILNPSGDLKSTEAVLAPELSQLSYADGTPWTSVVKREPSEEVFKAALRTSSQLLYFGHGAGSQYIRPRAIRKLEKCSEVVWLMGCSSGAVTEYDELEPFSVPMAYLQAGQASSEHPSQCMAVLATLWDVTDKDIDRFSLAVGQEWGLWQVPADATKVPAKTPRKRTLAAPVTPDRTAKMPKTPKARKTPGPARTPARSRSRVRFERGKQQSLVEAVAKSRDACFLRYLNGAAPVVYGVPVYLGD